MTARLTAIMLFISAALASPVAADGPIAADVDAALRRGVADLYKGQEADGSWEVSPRRVGGTGHGQSAGQWGGRTAITTYTLLAAGESPTDPRIEKAVAWLRDAEILGNYALGMRAQIWPYLPPTEENKNAALADAKLLLAGVQKQGRNRGLYDYLPAQSDRVDMSVSQYGVLGMWAAAEFVEVPPGYWREVEQAWLRWQRGGGWAYAGEPTSDKPVTASMTAAGIATLFITQDFTVQGGAQTRGNLQNPAIDRAMGLMVAGFPQLVDRAPKTPFYPGDNNRLYTLYGVERIGVASGLKYFGELDWYAEGARYLLDEQQKDGGWAGGRPATCFAVLFLARGREPVLANKAAYAVETPGGQTIEGDWNQRPRDLANIARWVGKQTERTLNWQILDLGRATVGDLHDAPILFLAGDTPLTLAEGVRDKLRQYVVEGGLLVFNPDGRNSRFEQSARQLVESLFADHPSWKWRPLEPGHPIYTNQQFKAATWRRRPNMHGFTNGVRELALILPGDLGASWQTGDLRQEQDFQLAANVYSYAVDRNQTYFKGDTHLVRPDPDKAATKTLALARVRHDGNWDPEPAAFDQFAATLRNDYGVGLTVTPIDPADLDAAAHPVAHVTGTGELPEPLKAALTAYLESGGTLLADAAGGDTAFAQSFEAWAATLGDAAADALRDPADADDPLYADTPGTLPDNLWRGFAAKQIVGTLSTPRLRVWRTGGAVKIIYSPEDLTAALVNYPSDGITGYTPAAADALMAKALLHAAGAADR